MDRLIKMILIKSAKYDYTEVDLDKNNLFIGANGAGKTTLLRAVLYFYTANAKGLGISSAKKISFLEYYFPYDDSYILYIYKKDKKYVLVTLYKNTKVGFRFCLLDKLPDIKTLFIEKNYPVSQGKLFVKLREIGNLSKVLSASEYRDVLYSKQSKLRHFSLFEAKEYDGFVKTLANIFINNKVDSEAIKKVIVSSLRVEKEIDIERIQRQLGDFNRTYEDIIAYEKSLKDIEKLRVLLYDFEEIRQFLGDDLASLYYSKEVTLQKQQGLFTTNVALKQKMQDLTQTMEKDRALFEKRDKRFEQEIGHYKGFVKKVKEKILYYKEQKIEFKRDAYDTLEIRKEDLRLLLLQKEFLTKEAGELRLSHENSLRAIENAYNSLFNTIETEKNGLKLEKNEAISTQKDKQRDRLSYIERDFTALQQEQKEQQYQCSLSLQELQYSLINEKNRSFVFEKEPLLQEYGKNLLNIEAEIKEKRHQLALLDAKLSKEEVTLQKDESHLLEQKEQSNREFNHKISCISELLVPKKSSLLYTLGERGYNLDKYLYCVKDEILHSEIELVSKSSEVMQLFEVNMDGVAIPKNKLSEDLQTFQEQKQEREEYFIRELEKRQALFLKEQKRVYREKKDLIVQIKVFERTLSNEMTSLAHLETQKKSGLEAFVVEQQKQISILQDSIVEMQKEYDKYSEKLKEQQAEYKRAIIATKAHFTKYFNEIEKTFKAEFEKLQKKALKAKEQREKEKQLQERLYKERLREKNVDMKALGELEKQEDWFQREIARVESYYPLIVAYKNDKKEYITRLKEYELLLKKSQQQQKELQETYALLEQKEKEQLQKFQNQKSQNILLIENYKGALLRVAEFEESASMQECKSLNLEYSANENFEELSLLLDRIYNLLGNYRENEKKISATLNRLHPLFNTSLHIKRFENPLESAYSIEEFHTNGKIKEFKDLQSRNLNQIVKNVVEEYDNLMFYSQQIEALIKKISKLFTEVEIGVIDELSLRYLRTNNRVIEKLFEVKELNSENPNGYGISLFSDTDNSKEMIELLKNLRDTIEFENVGSINLGDSFLLEFRVIENGNDSKYQPSLDNIGSNGTDVLVKTMIYIAMLYIFKTKTTKKELEIHVVLDEIGILSQRYLKELIEFANRYNIYFINGAPDEKLIGTYKRVSLVSNKNSKSIVQEIIAK